MRPKLLKRAVEFCIGSRMPVLIKGQPGVGKTSIIEQVAKKKGFDLIISHPVVSNPTDFKGLPFPSREKNKADFLPFGDLLKIMNADKPTVFFLDDLGQASAQVQASAMQLLLAREINGKKGKKGKKEKLRVCPLSAGVRH